MEREQMNYLLQQAPEEMLTELCERITREHSVEIIQRPTSQTLLVPVHDPITGGQFYSGEVLVTSTVSKVAGASGWSMVMDDQPALSKVIAVIDGAFAAGLYHAEIEELARLAEKQEHTRDCALNSKVEQTRVSFDLL